MTTTKTRVHELAKEIDKTSKEVLEACKKLGISANSAMNVLTDKEVDNLKKELVPPPPKRKLTAVFRPQNSAQGGRPSRPTPQVRPVAPGAGRPAQGPAAAPSGSQPAARAEEMPKKAAPEVKTVQPGVKVQDTPARAEKPVNKEAIRPQGETPAAEGVRGKEENPRPQGERPVRESGRAQTERPAREGVRGQGDRPMREGGYAQGDRPMREGSRAQGEHPVRDAARPTGERPAREGGRGQGDRPFREGGRPQGDRPMREGSRAQGDRPVREGGRMQGERPFREGGRAQGDRPPRDGSRYAGDRPAGSRYPSDRPAREGSRMQGDRPAREGGRYAGDRPAGSRYAGDRPAGARRPGDRPAGGGQRPAYGRDGSSQGRPQGGMRNDARGPAARSGRPGGESLPMGKPSAKQTQKPKTNSRQDRKRNEKQEAEEMFLKKGQRPGSRSLKAAPAEEEIKTIILPDTLTIKELADKMKLQPSAIVKKLFLAGKVVTINQEIDFEMAEEIAMEYEILCEREEKVDVLGELLKDVEDEADTLVKRPPVVCVMGHVDHGKTSLLDAIRSTHVTDKEAGGITQHIGAYVVECNGEPITFLDTPGHEAFTAMRMRGAQSTDIAILVVAADDGVMPQTVEAISHAKAAGVEIIVAVNKIDKPGANVEKVKQELTEYELIPEDWGGSTIFVPVSAHTKEGIDTLLEMILLASEVKELKANPNRQARGLVIEAELDKGKGPVATVLVQKGTLHVGDSIAVGPCYGRVRAMMDDKGRRVKEALPSTPVEILGLNNVPGAGEIFVATPTEKEARSFAETFISEGRERLLEDTKQKMSLDDLFSQIKAGNVKELNIIVKADVQGSVEAVKQSLVKLSNEEVVVKIIHGGVGAINESDVTLAATSNAIIIGFNVRPDATAKSIADREKVDLRLYKVIYQAIEDVEAAMKGMLDPVFEEKVIGHAVVRQLFKASGIGTIAGSFVTDGKFQRDCKVRISRGGDQLYEGALASLKRFKDDVKEVAKGYECGLVFEDFNDVQEDDTIEAYIMVEVPRQ